MPQIGPTQPWPRTQRMPSAIAGAHVQPWHYLAVAEYDAARGELTEMHRTASGRHIYTAEQMNQAIEWWNARAEAVEENEAPMRRHAEEAAEKIRARVAEDQRIAREASGSTAVGHPGHREPSPAGDEWEAHDEELLVALHPGLSRPVNLAGGYWGAAVPTSNIYHDRDDDTLMPIFRHAARHDPAHVLARSATILDVLADLEKIADSGHPDPRWWARLAICELAWAWELDDENDEEDGARVIAELDAAIANGTAGLTGAPPDHALADEFETHAEESLRLANDTHPGD